MQEEKINENENNKLADQQGIDLKEFNRIYQQMHTPWHRRSRKISRNEICPFCDSGTKFKKCECYEKYINTPLYTINHD